MNSRFKVFAGSNSLNFAKKICDILKISLGKSSVFKFSEGNTFVKIEEVIRGLDIFLIQSIAFDPNNEFMELLFWIDAFKRANAKTINVAIPYFSYAKGDKKDESRVSIRARICADCLEIAGASRIISMDLHSPQIQGFFKIPLDHLFGMQMIMEYIKKYKFKDIVIVSPDMGYIKNAHTIANKLQTDIAIGNKIRSDHTENAEVLNIIGNVKDKTAIIVDDFTLSANTLLSTAKKLKENGAKIIYACVSHSLINKEGVEKIENSCIEKLFTSDSIENKFELQSSKIETISVAPLFAEAFNIIISGKSLSELFENSKLMQNLVKK